MKSSSPPHHPLAAQHLEGKTIIFGRDLRRLFAVTHQVNLEGRVDSSTASGAQTEHDWKNILLCAEKHEPASRESMRDTNLPPGHTPTQWIGDVDVLQHQSKPEVAASTQWSHFLPAKSLAINSCTMATQLFAQMAAKLPTSGVGKPSKLTTSKQVPSNVLTALTSLSLTVPWWQNCFVSN